ncbi:hypothetical protein RAD16_12695 [Bradyrhizobium sp. 18BD]
MSTLDVAAGANRRDETVLLLAFAVGIVIAAWLRRIAGERAGGLSILIEILCLIVVGVLHNRLPNLAGTLGIAVVALLIVLLRCEATPREVIR